MTPRLHRFDAVDNFRDYGDYATAAGRRVKPGRLFRSAHHGKASDADLERLRALDLAVVVDLRRPSERRDHPCRRWTGFAAEVIESPYDDGGEAPHIAFLKSGPLTEDSGRAFMRDTYRRFAFAPQHVALFSRYFAALAEADGPVLIHCMAGKDRTGLLAALTHQLLGVHRDDMLADFLLTNEAVDLRGRAPRIAEQLKAMTGHAPSEDAVVAFLGVEAEYLDHAWDAIIERHGSVDAYLAETLGVDAARRAAIEARLSA